MQVGQAKTRTERAIFEQNPPYRVLSMDGGGIYGYFTTLMLRELCRKNQDFLLADQVTLFAGTSAGALNALILAKEKNPRDAVLDGSLERFFQDERVYSNKLDPVSGYLSLFMLTAWSGRKDFYSILDDYFGNMKMKDLQHRVMISAFDFRGEPDLVVGETRWKPRVFYNFPADEPDREMFVKDVAYGAASPPGLRPVKNGISDGGVISSDPSVTAIAKIIGRTRDVRDAIDISIDLIQLFKQKNNTLISILEAKEEVGSNPLSDQQFHDKVETLLDKMESSGLVTALARDDLKYSFRKLCDELKIISQAFAKFSEEDIKIKEEVGLDEYSKFKEKLKDFLNNPEILFQDSYLCSDEHAKFKDFVDNYFIEKLDTYTKHMSEALKSKIEPDFDYSSFIIASFKDDEKEIFENHINTYYFKTSIEMDFFRSSIEVDFFKQLTRVFSYRFEKFFDLREKDLEMLNLIRQDALAHNKKNLEEAFNRRPTVMRKGLLDEYFHGDKEKMEDIITGSQTYKTRYDQLRKREHSKIRRAVNFILCITKGLDISCKSNFNVYNDKDKKLFLEYLPEMQDNINDKIQGFIEYVTERIFELDNDLEDDDSVKIFLSDLKKKFQKPTSRKIKFFDIKEPLLGKIENKIRLGWYCRKMAIIECLVEYMRYRSIYRILLLRDMFYEKLQAQHTQELNQISILSLGVGSKVPNYFLDNFNFGSIPFSLLPTHPMKNFFTPPMVNLFLNLNTQDTTTFEAKQLLGDEDYFRLNPPVIGFPVPSVIEAVFLAKWSICRDYIIKQINEAADSDIVENEIEQALQWLHHNWHHPNQ